MKALLAGGCRLSGSERLHAQQHSAIRVPMYRGSWNLFPRLRLIKAGAEVAPGVTTFDTAGHTPGHISVHISSGREEMLLTGDVVVDTEISFLHPGWTFGFDLDVPLATKARIAFLDRAAADKTLVGSYHLPFPGFGHVVREGSGYRWLPADWQWTT
jgi:glyoxylase-like metal-dependent hydrolase (beta-lactamase superfamily II)